MKYFHFSVTIILCFIEATLTCAQTSYVSDKISNGAFSLAAAGKVASIYMVVVETTGAKPSYLGPPESFMTGQKSTSSKLPK